MKPIARLCHYRSTRWRARWVTWFENQAPSSVPIRRADDITAVDESKPPISVRTWYRVCSRSSLAPRSCRHYREATDAVECIDEDDCGRFALRLADEAAAARFAHTDLPRPHLVTGPTSRPRPPPSHAPGTAKLRAKVRSRSSGAQSRRRFRSAGRSRRGLDAARKIVRPRHKWASSATFRQHCDRVGSSLVSGTGSRCRRVRHSAARTRGALPLRCYLESVRSVDPRGLG